MTTATEIVTDALQWVNRLSPGETLNADDLAAGLLRLNTIVDRWGASKSFLYKSVITSAAQTGNITLAAGDWAAIPVGAQILEIAIGGEPIEKLTMQQYHSLYDVTTTGTPTMWAYDGLSNVYLVPVSAGSTVKMLTAATATAFADTTTSYTMPPGYKAALGIELAVSLAPTLLGKVPPELLRERKDARNAIAGFIPAVMNYGGYTEASASGSILNGW